MVTDSKTVRIPEVGEYVRMYGTLVEVQDVTPKEIVLDYVFERTEARLDGLINGKKVKEFGTFNDYYGKETCVKLAITEAQDKIKFFGESNLEFVVVKITRRVRMRPDRQKREYFYDDKFRTMTELEHGRYYDLPGETEEVVWRSSESK
jgi:hypothetical protein